MILYLSVLQKFPEMYYFEGLKKHCAGDTAEIAGKVLVGCNSAVYR